MKKLAFVVVAVVACNGKKESTTPKGVDASTPSKIDEGLCNESGKRVVNYDLNKDGKDDTWWIYSGNTLTCKKHDWDHDGKKDWVTGFDASGARVWAKADLDYDGKFDMAEVFAGADPSEVERDTDFDGKFDVKEVYSSGMLASVKRDRNGDSKPDQWENYTGGSLISVSYDDDYDGKVDRNETPSTPTPAPAPPTPPDTTSNAGSGADAAAKK